MRKWIVGVIALLVTTSALTLIQGAAGATQTGSVTGDFPNRLIELTKQKGSSEFTMAIPYSSVGTWWLTVESAQRGITVLTEVWSNEGGRDRLVCSSELSTYDDVSKSVALGSGLSYWVHFEIRGMMGGYMFLRESLLGGGARAESGTWNLPVNVADAAFDPIRPYVYLTDISAKSLYFVNSVTGNIEKTFVFDLMPESLALTPDSSMLFVALLTREHSLYWFDDQGHIGYIGVFDLSSQTMVKQYQINEDPYDLQATSNGLLVVSSGSGQWSYIRVYSADSGKEMGNSWIRAMSKIALHPSDRIVYAADTDISPDNVNRYDLSKRGVVTEPFGSPYWGEHRIWGNLWVSPFGDVVITRGGDVFSAGRQLSSDMTYITSMASGPVECLAFELNSKLILTGEGSALRYYSLTDYSLLGQTISDRSISFVGVQNEVVYMILAASSGSTPIVVMNGLFHNGVFNLPPTAILSVTPDAGPTGTVFTLDASASSDPEDPLASLSFKWDFDNDGIWDTPYSSNPVVTLTLESQGTYVVRVTVRDALGLIDDCSGTVVVTIDPDPGLPGPAHEPFVFPYLATDVAFDPIRDYMYVTDKIGKHVFFVNTQTGTTERQFDFEYMPESVTITPDGSRLFVCLLTREHSPYWFDEEGHVGFIASFDLSTQTKDRQFMICEDPYDVVATSNGHLVVSGGSGQHTKMRVFRATDGALLSSSYVFEGGKIALHPSELMIYCASTELWPSNVYRYDISPEGVLSAGRSSPYHGYNRFDGDMWISPIGDIMITRGGDVFTAGRSFDQDMTFVARMAVGPIEAMGFDIYRGVVFTIEGDSMLTYSLSGYVHTGSTNLLTEYEFMGVTSDETETCVRMLDLTSDHTIMLSIVMMYVI